MVAIRPEIRRLTRYGAPAFNCTVTVESIRRVSPSFVRIGLHSKEFGAYRDVLPADAFKIMLPPDGIGAVDFPRRGDDGIPYWPDGTRQPKLRAFTVRRFDPDRQVVEFDAVMHAGGLVTHWLEQASAGAVLGLGGMRHEFYPGDGVDRHLLVGDSSALPAVAAIVESLPDEVLATVYLAVNRDEDRTLVPERDRVRVHWVAGGSPAGPGSDLARAVREHERPGRRIQAWLAAESGVMRELRRWVSDELGVAHDDLHSAAYWKSSLDSTEVDAVSLARYRELIDTGAEVTDPDVRDEVELSA